MPKRAAIRRGVLLAGLACTWLLAKAVPRVERLVPTFR